MNQPRGLLKLLKVDSLIHNLTDYIETRIALIKAEAKDDVMKAMRAAMIYGAIAVLGLFFVLFLSLTIALVLNDALDSWFWGFAIVTGLYLIMLIVLYTLRDSEKVKMMFGDGSLAFLKKKPKQDTQKNEQDHDQALEDEAELRRQGRQENINIIEHERVTFDRAPQPSNGRDTVGEPAEIKIEKKEE